MRRITDDIRQCEWQGHLLDGEGVEALLFWSMGPFYVQYKIIYKKIAAISRTLVIHQRQGYVFESRLQSSTYTFPLMRQRLRSLQFNLYRMTVPFVPLVASIEAW
jgi:hypothetical protein